MLSTMKIIVITCLMVIVNASAAVDIDKQKEALEVIADFADRLCEKIPLTGNSEDLDLSGVAKVELSGLLKKIADLGVEGGVKYQKVEYEGLLQKDLATLIKDSSKCKLEVWKDLKDKLLLTQPKQTKNFIGQKPLDEATSFFIAYSKNESVTEGDATIYIAGAGTVNLHVDRLNPFSTVNVSVPKPGQYAYRIELRQTEYLVPPFTRGRRASVAKIGEGKIDVQPGVGFNLLSAITLKGKPFALLDVIRTEEEKRIYDEEAIRILDEYLRSNELSLE